MTRFAPRIEPMNRFPLPSRERARVRGMSDNRFTLAANRAHEPVPSPLAGEG